MLWSKAGRAPEVKVEEPKYIQMEFMELWEDYYRTHPWMRPEERRQRFRERANRDYKARMSRIQRPLDSLEYRNKSKDNSIRPKVKYLHVSSIFRSGHTKNWSGTIHRRKVYGFGILTEDNDYYYSEIYFKHGRLAKSISRYIAAALTTPFCFTENTRITISHNINEYNDPVKNFIFIMASTLGLIISNTDFTKMLMSINRFFGLCKTRKDSEWHNKKVLEAMLAQDKFVFITDPKWLEKLDELPARRKESNLECAVAMIYNYTCEVRQEEKAKYLEERKKRTEMGIPVREYHFKAERKKIEKEKRKAERERKRKWKELCKNFETPPTYYRKHKLLGKIKYTNLLWWENPELEEDVSAYNKNIENKEK